MYCVQFGTTYPLSCSLPSSIIGTSVVSLLITIDEMHILSKKMFFNSLSLHASRLMDKVQYELDDLHFIYRKLFV